MKPTFLWRGLCLFISLYSGVSMIAVCVFLCRTYNAARIPHTINLSDRNSASSTDATFAVGDLQDSRRYLPMIYLNICVFHHVVYIDQYYVFKTALHNTVSVILCCVRRF